MALRAQLANTKVHVLEALPPLVDTKMTSGRNDKKMSAADCAAAFIAAIESNATQTNVGMVKVLSAVYGLSPAIARRIMLKF
jgi:uncharacterized oxidoreductase